MALLLATSAHAGPLDVMGFTDLRAAHPELTGAGETVAQPEAGSSYQANPVVVGQPSELFHYYDATHPYGGAGASFSAGLSSNHAKDVGNNLYGPTTGGAPGVQAVENFNADYFVFDIVINIVTNGNVSTWEPVEIASPIVNQSFVFGDSTSAEDVAAISAFYDAYANEFGTLFVNGLDNGAGSLTNAPATMFNGIAVGRSDGNHSGRAQLVAPAVATSYATPYVSAAAVVLRQAAGLGYFQALVGTDATDARLLKAGLLNGATKTSGWMHTSTDPLDTTYGAGVVNVNTSFDTLSGGQHLRSVANTTVLNTISTATPFALPVTGFDGWNLTTLTATNVTDAVHHYFFDLSDQLTLTLTATLTWNSLVDLSQGLDVISNFDLVLVNTITHSVVWSSASTTQNVEHIYLTNLSGSKYDLQVILRGGPSAPIFTDKYAVAWSWQDTGTAPVPESDGMWVIGAAGLFFIVRKRLAVRRTRS
jgi:hypothetical protein